jgi:hypothetical protein
VRLRGDAMSHTPRPAPAAWVGIDVSQHTLDACDEVRYLSHNLTRQPLGWPTVEC